MDNKKTNENFKNIVDESLDKILSNLSDDIKKEHNVNEKKLHKILLKMGLISQNTSYLDMFKTEVNKEIDSCLDDYKKIEKYQEVSKDLDTEVSKIFKEMKIMEFNISESTFVDSFTDLSDNIMDTKMFLMDCHLQIDEIYKKLKHIS